MKVSLVTCFLSISFGKTYLVKTKEKLLSNSYESEAGKDYGEDDEQDTTATTSKQNKLPGCNKSETLMTFNVTMTCDSWEIIQKIMNNAQTPGEEAGDYQQGEIWGNLLGMAAQAAPGLCQAATGLVTQLAGQGGITPVAPVAPVLPPPVNPVDPALAPPVTP